jgi:VIT1/CCC1 family predicted Fe2+/Mn2+ transporter
MNLKKSLENRIRGWLPKTPNLPKQPSTPRFERQANYQQTQMLFAVAESKIKENTWFLMGAGLVAVVLGLLTAMYTYILYEEELLALDFGKIPTNNPLFSELPRLIAGCLIIAAAGGIAGSLGYLIDKNQSAKEFFYRARPSRDKGNKLFKMGVSLFLCALFFLSSYLVSADILSLGFAIITAALGLSTLIFGILTLKRK